MRGLEIETLGNRERGVREAPPTGARARLRVSALEAYPCTNWRVRSHQNHTIGQSARCSEVTGCDFVP